MIAIASIAIPTINSSLERSKNNQNEKRKKILESAAELQVSEHKTSFDGTCSKIGTLFSEGYIDEEASKDADGKAFNGAIRVNLENGEYSYTPSKDIDVNNCK